MSLINNTHFPKEHQSELFRMYEEFAFHPLLAKLLLPRALESLNDNSFGIIYTNSKWDKVLKKMGMDAAAYTDFSKVIESHQQKESIPLPEIVVKTILDIYQQTKAKKGLFIQEFKNDNVMTMSAKVMHELTHDVMSVLFEGKTSVPYGRNYGVQCSKTSYQKLFNEFYHDVKFIYNDMNSANNKESSTKSFINKDNGEFEITIFEGQTPKAVTCDGKSLKAISLFMIYDEDLHEEAIVFYPQMIAEKISKNHMTFMQPMSDHYDECILPAIDKFSTNHPNCHLLQGIPGCINHALSDDSL